jgi:hypothetical protein
VGLLKPELEAVFYGGWWSVITAVGLLKPELEAVFYGGWWSVIIFSTSTGKPPNIAEQVFSALALGSRQTVRNKCFQH